MSAPGDWSAITIVIVGAERSTVDEVEVVLAFIQKPSRRCLDDIAIDYSENSIICRPIIGDLTGRVTSVPEWIVPRKIVYLQPDLRRIGLDIGNRVSDASPKYSLSGPSTY